MAKFNIREHVDNAMDAITGAIGILLAAGIGLYILVYLNNGTGGQLNTIVSIFNTNVPLVGTVVALLFIATVAGIGIGLIHYLRGRE